MSTKPIEVDPESNVNYARLQCQRSGGYGSGRCSWQTDTATQCPAPVPDVEFFCPAHAVELVASGDPCVRTAWDRLQAEAAAYRDTLPKDPPR